MGGMPPSGIVLCRVFPRRGDAATENINGGWELWEIHASPKGFAGHGGSYVLGGAKRG